MVDWSKMPTWEQIKEQRLLPPPLLAEASDLVERRYNRPMSVALLEELLLLNLLASLDPPTPSRH